LLPRMDQNKTTRSKSNKNKKWVWCGGEGQSFRMTFAAEKVGVEGQNGRRDNTRCDTVRYDFDTKQRASSSTDQSISDLVHHHHQSIKRPTTSTGRTLFKLYTTSTRSGVKRLAVPAADRRVHCRPLRCRRRQCLKHPHPPHPRPVRAASSFRPLRLHQSLLPAQSASGRPH